MKKYLIFAFCFSICAETQASDLPIYDLSFKCKEQARDRGVFDTKLYNICFDLEQGEYNVLKQEWKELNQPVKDYCMKVSSSVGKGSYSVLRLCIKSEINAAAAVAARKFKY